MNSISTRLLAPNVKGIIAGVLGAAFFGFIPAFSKPVLNIGLSPSCVLFYRFGVATVIIAFMLLLQKKSLSIPMKSLPPMFMLSIFYCCSGLFLILGYKFMSGGVTGVIHFSYPIFVMILSAIFYKEHIRLSSAIAILIAITGIYCLGVLGGKDAFIPGADHTLGIAIVLFSGIACAGYMVGVNKARTRTIPSFLFTFWLLLLSTLVFGIISFLNNTLVLVTSPFIIANFLGLAIIATVLSNFFLVYSIKHLGSTYASILGAVEPATAVVVCIILFSESVNLPIVIGIVLIFTAVLIVVTRNK